MNATTQHLLSFSAILSVSAYRVAQKVSHCKVIKNRIKAY